MNTTFTIEELFTMSSGVLALMQNASNAQKMIVTEGAMEAIQTELDSLKNLNSKICRAISDAEQEAQYAE